MSRVLDLSPQSPAVHIILILEPVTIMMWECSARQVRYTYTLIAYYTSTQLQREIKITCYVVHAVFSLNSLRAQMFFYFRALIRIGMILVKKYLICFN